MLNEKFCYSSALFAVFFGFGFLLPVTAHAQKCDAILADGIFETRTFTDNTSISNAMHSVVCSNRSRNSNSNSTFGISLPLPDLATALGLNSSNEIKRETIDEYCRSGSRVYNYQAAVNVLRSVASERVVNAWSDCVSDARGLTCNAESLGAGQFSITISWRRQNTGAGTEAAIIESEPQVTNADCPAAPIQAGAKVPDTSSLIEFCRFVDPSVRATVGFNTSQGAVQCSAEPEVLKARPIDAANACAQGNSETCLELIRLTQSAQEVCERTGRDTFDLYIQCGNAATSMGKLKDLVAETDRACWRGGARCAQARGKLAEDAFNQARLVEAILSGGSFLGAPAPNFD